MWTRRGFITTSTGCALAANFGSLAYTAWAGPPKWKMPEKGPFRVVENTWIPMKDGIRLGARLWIPNSADHTPVPVVWEYIPYRKRDLERQGDDSWAESFVPYGFAFVRVDIRGSGDSDGLLVDEYRQQEQEDAVEVIAWLARQPWSAGAVGMRGISWGGFNSLQVAALAPPALKAIMPECATDNRYTDDAHYVGGALTLDNFDWGAEFRNVLVGPPDPEIVGAKWRDMWMARLDASTAVVANWLTHQRYDSYWQHGSIATNYGAIKCAVYLVGGQIDSYRDFLPRTLTHLTAPRKGLMGPWGHRYPQKADPGPGLDWVTEEVRWWTHWLKGMDTGIMDEPMFHAYMEEQTASEVWPSDTPGRWVSETAWPSTRIIPRTMFLNVTGLGTQAEASATLTCRSQETLGLTKREWFPWNMSVDLPPDQTPDDKRSLVFDSSPLEEDLEILGNPMLRIHVVSNQPLAKIAVRLNEVLANNTAWSVSYGILNLTHRDGHTNPAPLEVGKSYQVEVPCYFTAHRFKKGSRIRVAVSESLWPMVWPSPQPVELNITAGVSTLTLPVRPVTGTRDGIPIVLLKERIKAQAKADPNLADEYKITQSGPDASGLVAIHKRLRDLPEKIPATGTIMSGGSDWTMSIREGDPNSSVWRVEWFITLRRDQWYTTTRSALEIRSSESEFHLTESITALENEKVVYEKAWDNRIKRDLM